MALSVHIQISLCDTYGQSCTHMDKAVATHVDKAVHTWIKLYTHGQSCTHMDKAVHTWTKLYTHG